jgi:FPC/CPF motif-containing protein YcgG
MQLLHSLDPEDWDPETSSDADSANFSFSLFGTSFYLVGLHPESSRKARQFSYPTIVFNLHEQFDKLRDMGAYHTIRDRIRERDEEKNGSFNPMLEDFGESSEARQYSGRQVGEDWKCPFHKKVLWNT